MDLINLLMKEKMASKNEDSILNHDISNEDGSISDNEELSISIMQLNETYVKILNKLISIIMLITN